MSVSYRDFVSEYISNNFGERGIATFTNVKFGKNIFGKSRYIDVLVIDESTNAALAIQCREQSVRGTTEEKLLFTFEDLSLLPIRAFVCYSGNGFSDGAKAYLAENQNAIQFEMGNCCEELNEIIAIYFGFWDVLVGA